MLEYFMLLAVFAGAFAAPPPNPHENHEPPPSITLEATTETPQPIFPENPAVIPQAPCFIIPGYHIPYIPNVNIPNYGYGPCKFYRGYQGQAGNFEQYYVPQVGHENVPAHEFPQVPNGQHHNQPHGNYYDCYHYFYPYFFHYPNQPYYPHYASNYPSYQHPFEFSSEETQLKEIK